MRVKNEDGRPIMTIEIRGAPGSGKSHLARLIVQAVLFPSGYFFRLEHIAQYDKIVILSRPSTGARG